MRIRKYYEMNTYAYALAWNSTNKNTDVIP